LGRTRSIELLTRSRLFLGSFVGCAKWDLIFRRSASWPRDTWSPAPPSIGYSTSTRIQVSQKASKIAPAKPLKINGRISPIRPFQKVWVVRRQELDKCIALQSTAQRRVIRSQKAVTNPYGFGESKARAALLRFEDAQK
jgi:hypothetical protein